MPSLSYTGKLTLVGAVGLAVGGLLGGIGTAAAAGSAALTGLALAWVVCLPLPRRMRRERLEFTWWLPSRVGGVRRPDEPVPLRIALRNPTDLTLTLGTPRLALSPGLRYARPRGHRVIVPPRSVATFELEVRPTHAGRHILHGAWMTLGGPLGVVWTPLYFPNPLVLEVQPRAYGAGALARPGVQPAPAQRAGRATRRVGEGPELRELREFQPGDPYRRIAWKASARRGRLVVRETEDEAQTTRMLVVDASASMRGDHRGGAKLDYAIELVAQASKQAVASGDRVGLVGFDARVVGEVPPGDGPMHARAVVQAALELRALVDEDLTELDDEGLVETVARYFREQEGVDVFRGAHPMEARRRLAKLCETAARADPAMKLPVVARDGVGRVLRAFCRARAIPLPLRHDATGAGKTRGLAQALHAAIERSRESRTVLVVSDLDAVTDLGPVKQALGAAKQKHHRVIVVAPAGSDFTGRSPSDARDGAVHRAVAELFLADERARLRELRQALAPMGVPLYTASAKDPAAHWLRRAAAPRTR